MQIAGNVSLDLVVVRISKVYRVNLIKDGIKS